MSDIDGLLKEGLLKRIPPSDERAVKSLKIAERYLRDARKSFDFGSNEMCIIASYSAMFHAARAIMFSEGFAERSHAAVVAYLRERHKELGIETINAFDIYRKLRHSVSYGLDTVVNENDSSKAHNFANSFVTKVKERLEKK